MTTSTETTADVDAVGAMFGAFASGDLAALSGLLHPDATWHHHNDDRLGPQVVLVTVEAGRVRTIEQFVGDPAAVAAFWA